MKKHQRNNSTILLIVSSAMLANMSFAQNPPTNAAQEALDFMNSPQGSNVVNKVQLLLSASLGKIGISNELERISADNNITPPIRQFAKEALLTYDNSATNTYDEVVAFLTAWPFKDETPPPMITNTILVMKRGLEIGSSGFVHLENILTNTNYPTFYREQTGQLVTNLVLQLTGKNEQ